MADWTIKRLEQMPDVLGDYPGEMRMSAASDLGTEQVSFTWRRMPAQTGGKGSYGHRHKTQEEVYFVASGTLQFKLEDEVIDVEDCLLASERNNAPIAGIDHRERSDSATGEIKRDSTRLVSSRCCSGEASFRLCRETSRSVRSPAR